ncbi:hypothetical protein B0H17DRAFT_1191882 [Mycena rosella]|uniref:Uncharacterized protein n=1 Tax=Mycena rosella TaxID=1033263 RepID=A0AAD7GXM3_MYCRO|nr:hypothetical protein B0H17DRAFT_1191882 [Mycena rosella]
MQVPGSILAATTGTSPTAQRTDAESTLQEVFGMIVGWETPATEGTVFNTAAVGGFKDEDENIDALVKRGRSRPKGSKNKKSTATPAGEMTSSAPPQRRGWPPKEQKNEDGKEEKSKDIPQKKKIRDPLPFPLEKHPRRRPHGSAFGPPKEKKDKDGKEDKSGSEDPKSGRPPKEKKDKDGKEDNSGSEEPTPKRKRGRPPKAAVPADSNAEPKKRGRPPKKVEKPASASAA